MWHTHIKPAFRYEIFLRFIILVLHHLTSLKGNAFSVAISLKNCLQVSFGSCALLALKFKKMHYTISFTVECSCQLATINPESWLRISRKDLGKSCPNFPVEALYHINHHKNGHLGFRELGVRIYDDDTNSIFFLFWTNNFVLSIFLFM